MDKLFFKFLRRIFQLFRIKSLSIYQLTLILLVFTASFSVLLVSGLWAYTESIQVRQNIEELKEHTLNRQKEKLKAEVHRVTNYIEFRKNDTLSKPILEIKNEVLDYFKDVRFGNDGYIFINTYDGNALLFDGQKLETPKDITDLKDPNGFRIFQKELELANLPDGGYFQYLFKKIYDTKPLPKISYVIGFDEWEWIIGTGDYLDNIEEDIALLEKELKNDLYQNFIIVSVVFITVLLLLILLAWLTAKSIQNQFDQLVRFLKSTESNKKATVLYDDIFIRELKAIGHDIVLAEKMAKQFGDIINQSKNEIYIFGQDDSRFVHANIGAVQNCGYSLNELQKKTPLFLMSELNVESFVTLIEPLKQKHSEQIRFETIHQRKDQTFYPVEVHLTQSFFNEQAVYIAFIYDISIRKEAENQLQISKQRFVDLFNNAPISLWEEDFTELMAYLEKQLKKYKLPIEKLFIEYPEVLQNCSGLAKVIDVNNHTLKLYEARSKEELIGNLDKIFTPESFQVFSQCLVSLYHGKNYFSAEGKNISLRGKELDLLLRWSFLPGVDNQAIKVIVSVIDLTELHKVEQKLKFSEVQFRAIFEQAADAIYLSDFDGNLLEVNREAIKELGYSREEFLQMKVWELDTTYTDLVTLRDFWGNLKPNEPIAFETFHKRRDGSIFPVEIRAALAEIGGKKAVLGFAQNISERIRVNELLQKSEEKFRLAFVTSPDAIAITRLSDGMYLDINNGFTQMIGYVEEDVIGKTSVELNVWANNEDRNELVKGLKKKGVYENLEAVFLTKNGTEVNGLMSAVVMELHNEPHLLSITRDITSRKKAEEELKKHRENLEVLIKERTKEIEEKNKALERINKLFVGRELRMKELKEEIEKLKER